MVNQVIFNELLKINKLEDLQILYIQMVGINRQLLSISFIDNFKSYWSANHFANWLIFLV